LYAPTPPLLLTKTEFRMLTLAVPPSETTPRLVLYSKRLFSMTVFEFVSLPVVFRTPRPLLRNSQLFTIRFDPAAPWLMPAARKTRATCAEALVATRRQKIMTCFIELLLSNLCDPNWRLALSYQLLETCAPAGGPKS